MRASLLKRLQRFVSLVCFGLVRTFLHETHSFGSSLENAVNLAEEFAFFETLPSSSLVRRLRITRQKRCLRQQKCALLARRRKRNHRFQLLLGLFILTAGINFSPRYRSFPILKYFSPFTRATASSNSAATSTTSATSGNHGYKPRGRRSYTKLLRRHSERDRPLPHNAQPSQHRRSRARRWFWTVQLLHLLLATDGTVTLPVQAHHAAGRKLIATLRTFCRVHKPRIMNQNCWISKHWRHSSEYKRFELREQIC